MKFIAVLKKCFCNLLGLAVLVALAACGPSRECGKQVLCVVPPTDLEILDPTWTTGYLTRDHGYMVYDTLFGIDSQGEIKPQMVDSHIVSEDRKTWTFTLREGLEFHDGKPVTSDDVIASIQRWAQRDTMGQRLLSFVESLELVSPKTFRMKLRAPYGLVIESFGKPDVYVLFILPKRMADTPFGKQIEDPIGSGPFIFQKGEWRPGERIVYTRNPRYKPRQEPASGTAGGKVVKVDRVEWRIIKDPQTQVNALLTGEVDLIVESAVDLYSSLKKDPGIHVFPINTSGYQFFLRFNHLQPPFDNPKVRRAAMAAMNQPAFLQTQVGIPEMYNVCFSVYACDSPYVTTAGMDFIAKPDLQNATQMLSESGYNGEAIVILQPTDLTVIAKLPVVAMDQLRKAGFKVDLQSMPMGMLLTRRANKTGWHLFPSYGAWTPRTAPVSENALSGAGPKAWFGWPSDPNLETLRDAFAFATTDENRKTIAERIQVRAMEVATHVPLGEFRTMAAARKKVTGLVTGNNFTVYWNVEKQ